MQIAHAAWSLFDVRLQMINRVVKFGVTLISQPDQVLDERRAIRPEVLRQPRRQHIIQVVIADEESFVDEADAEFDVGLIELAALRYCANRLAEAQTPIPQGSQKCR